MPSSRLWRPARGLHWPITLELKDDELAAADLGFGAVADQIGIQRPCPLIVIEIGGLRSPDDRDQEKFDEILVKGIANGLF